MGRAKDRDAESGVAAEPTSVERSGELKAMQGEGVKVFQVHREGGRRIARCYEERRGDAHAVHAWGQPANLDGDSVQGNGG